MICIRKLKYWKVVIFYSYRQSIYQLACKINGLDHQNMRPNGAKINLEVVCTNFGTTCMDWVIPGKTMTSCKNLQAILVTG